MAEERAKRKLTAILSADVKGYSRLMAHDEEATVQTITTYRELMTGLIQDHRGRVVDAKGDNILAEFSSVVDAVRCAVEVQQELKERNSDLPEHRRMEFRIGINLGDVIDEEGTIYGDGVNVAARLEGLAEGGGICISGTAFDQVKNRISVGYEYQGKQNVKNMPDPVRVYKVLMEPEAAGKVIGKEAMEARPWRWAAVVAAIAVALVIAAVLVRHFYLPPPLKPASVDRMAQALPDKPSIAVLPFDNMSGDPEQEYFADGLTEEIITALSKVPRLFVIARNSTFTYKGKPVKVQQVSEDLGVQYVLEGSVRKSEKRVRITAQLVDALNGRHLWAEKYDRDLKDIFVVQDEITFEVIAALQVNLTEGEQALIVAQRTNNFEAYTKFLQGLEYAKAFNKEGNLLARKRAEEAIALDPNYPRGYRLLATTHMLEVWLGISKSPKQSLATAAELYQKVIDMDPTDAVAHGFLGMVYALLRQHGKGLIEAQKAVAINPNAADAHSAYGNILRLNGMHMEAVDAIRRAVRLNPLPPTWYWHNLGYAYCHVNMYEESIAAHKKALSLKPDNQMAHVGLAVSYWQSGREAEARAEVEEVLRLNPQFCVESITKGWPYKNQSDKDFIVCALREAGLPETPPLPLPDRPSIAVLPFANIGDPEQEYIADGITEQIITALARNPSLFVIASNSSFTYKGKPVMIQQVSRELGVRYVMEGSVQRAGDRLRITAQLIEAAKGEHIWAEKYDRDLKDIFALQDEITMKVLASTMGKLLGYADLPREKGTTNVEAYLKFLKATTLLATNEANNRLAMQLYEESIALDPEFPGAYSRLGMAYYTEVFNGWSKSPGKDLQRAVQLAQEAIRLDPSLVHSHATLGWICMLQGKHEEAVAEGQKAVSVVPSSGSANAHLAAFLAWADQSDEAISVSQNALRLNPFPTDWELCFFGNAYLIAGRYEEALLYYRKAQERNPDNMWSHFFQASILGNLGREEEASVAAKELLRTNPRFSVEHWVKWPGCKNRDKWNQIIEGLRKAGLT